VLLLVLVLLLVRALLLALVRVLLLVLVRVLLLAEWDAPPLPAARRDAPGRPVSRPRDRLACDRHSSLNLWISS
jgi:hypothetical protein